MADEYTKLARASFEAFTRAGERIAIPEDASVELLNKLEKAGWIIREKNPSMSRRKVVSITEKAVRMKPELSSAGATLEEEFTKNLTEQEVAEYVRLSNKILREE